MSRGNGNGRAPMRLYIHHSSDVLCLARGLERSGHVPRSMSRGDLLWSLDGQVPIGRIASVAIDHVEPEWWTYTVEYQPAEGTPQAIWDAVLHRVPEQPEQEGPTPPEHKLPIASSGPPQPDARATGARGKKKATGRAPKNRAAHPAGQAPDVTREADSQAKPEPEASVF